MAVIADELRQRTSVKKMFYHADRSHHALWPSHRRDRKTERSLPTRGCGGPARDLQASDSERAKDDCSAISLALEKNVSAIDDEMRGIGLWLASQLVRRNGGELLILSNEGGIDVRGKSEEQVTGYYWPGTLVAVEFDILQPITTTEIYDSGDFKDIDVLRGQATDTISF